MARLNRYTVWRCYVAYWRDNPMCTLERRPAAPDVATRRHESELGWIAHGLAALVVGLTIGAALIAQGWIF